MAVATAKLGAMYLANLERRSSDEMSTDLAHDIILELVAEEARLSHLAVAPHSAADALYFALPKEERRRLGDMEERRLAGRMGELYRQAEDLDDRAQELFDRVAATKATTIAGVIAQIELLIAPILSSEGYAEIVIAGLKDIAHRIGEEPIGDAENDLAAEPEVIGFGEPEPQ